MENKYSKILVAVDGFKQAEWGAEIGRASCRERV